MQKAKNSNRDKIIVLALIVLTANLLLLKLAPNSPCQFVSWWIVFAPIYIPLFIYSVMLLDAIVDFIFQHDKDDREV